MAEEEKPVGNEPKTPEAPTISTQRRKRSFKIDRDAVAKYVLNSLTRDLNDRDERIRMRMDRYAQLMGWLPEKDWPWPNAANFHLPIMLIASLRVKSTLENACKSIRPMLQSKSLQRRNVGKQDQIDKLLDFQFFIENEGERKLDDYITNFVNDETAFSFVHYVRERQSYRDIRVLPAPNPNLPLIAELLQKIQDLFPGPQTNAVMKDKNGWEWEVDFIDEERSPNKARVEFYDRDDGKIEAHLSYTATTRDGPIVEIQDFEDITFPIRAANLQPPGPANPLGADHVNRICRVTLDTIRRRMDDGTYDLLTEEDYEEIKTGKSPVGSGRLEEQPKEQKDEMAGVNPTYGGNEYEERQVIEHYGRYDVDHDDLKEDVIFWVERDSEKLLKAVYLSEMYPGLPIKRPLHAESFITIPNRVYGLSLPELLESLQKIMQMLLNQHIDWGTIVNVPFFFYRAASGMKPEIMRLEPGDGYPLDDPTRDVHFPIFQQRGDAYTINTLTLLQQFVERITSISDVQFGRVPTGKASALRTMGTTLSLLAQGDARSEQVLRRLFHGLAAIYQMIHRLNRRYLPERKEVRVVGISEAGQDAYTDISRDDIQADIDFDFRATILNTNKQLLSQAFNEVAALLISPLAIQAGLVSEREVYELMRDKLMALDLDPDKYMKRPPDRGPKLLAEEAMSAMVAGEAPVGEPLEMPREHLAKLDAFIQSPQFGLLTSAGVELFRAWRTKVMGIMVRQQVLAQMARQLAMGGGGPGGVPTTIQSPAMGENQLIENNELIEGEFNQ